MGEQKEEESGCLMVSQSGHTCSSLAAAFQVSLAFVGLWHPYNVNLPLSGSILCNRINLCVFKNSNQASVTLS